MAVRSILCMLFVAALAASSVSASALRRRTEEVEQVDDDEKPHVAAPAPPAPTAQEAKEDIEFADPGTIATEPVGPTETPPRDLGDRGDGLCFSSFFKQHGNVQVAPRGESKQLPIQ